MRAFRLAVGLLVVLTACDPGAPAPPESGPSIAAPSTTPTDLDVVSCRGLEVPFDREVNTGLDREGGTLEFSYYVARLQRDRSVTIRYRDDPWCRRNPDTRRLIQHVGAGREIVGCLDLPDEPPAGMTRVELWFADGDDEKAFGTSVVVLRDVPTTDAIAAATMQAWIDGPTDEEKLVSALPTASRGTELLGIDIQDGTATVDLSGDFEHTNLGTTGEGAILEALAGTLTQFDTVERGLLKIDGEFKDYFMGHGFLVSEKHPLTRPGPKRYRPAPPC